MFTLQNHSHLACQCAILHSRTTIMYRLQHGLQLIMRV